MIKLLDYALGAAALGIGMLHSFVVTPQIHATVTADAIWFFGAGLAGIFAGLLNLLRAAHGDQLTSLRWSAALASALMLATALAYGIAETALSDPTVWLQIGVYSLLTALGLFRKK